MDKAHAQAWVLRVAGATEFLAFLAVVMPRSWMESAHLWLNLGQMPDGPIIMYMIRQASYVYGVHGVSLWILASDVKRFQPLIKLNGISFLLASVVFLAIDYSVGMPMWWTVGDVLSCLFFGLALLVLSPPENSHTA